MNEIKKITSKIKYNKLKYINYILRGIIDWDGWIRKHGKEFFISSASESFINWCKDSLKSLGFIKLKIKYIANEHK